VSDIGAVCVELGIRAIPTEVSDGYLIARCDHAALADAMRAAGVVADALVTDAPYSARTHDGHGSFTEAERREVNYATWDESAVVAFVGAWHLLTSGWVVSLTDHVLVPSWESALEGAYRYVFSPLACIESGSRFRAVGDGPPQWATWAVVARPRSREWSRWATIEARAARNAPPLAGAYIGPSERKAVVGGKPLWLMRAIVRDYSAPGDLVCDPCMGAGTTLVAAVELGRRAIGCEPDEGRFGIAAKRLREARRPLPGLVRPAAEQSAMDLGGER
jgi:site-specific DNA-methyltransferase (adenine-specific)